MDFLEGLEIGHGTCGTIKCFYPSAAGGYLLAMASEDSSARHTYEYLQWERAWAFGNRLKLQYGAEHLLSAPPMAMRISGEVAARLNADKSFISHDHGGADNSNRYSTNGTVLVQKVRECPEPPCIIMGGKGSKLEYFAEHFPMDFLVRAVGDKSEFFCNLAGNLSATRSMLLREACLIRDFQIFIGSRGGIFHLDLDRCESLFSGGTMSRELLPPHLQNAFVRILAISRQLVTVGINCSAPVDPTLMVSQTQQKYDQKSVDFLKELEVGHGTCRAFKCYYPTPGGGYWLGIASQSPSSTSNSLLRWERAWAFGNRLKLQYGAEHLLSAPPMAMRISGEVAARLNADKSFISHDSNRYTTNGTVLVQKVRECPEPPCIIMGGKGSKLEYFAEHFPMDFLVRAVGDKSEFFCNLAGNLSATRSMLLREACLIRDFQIFIGSRGGIFHLDLDRCESLFSGGTMSRELLPPHLQNAFVRILAISRQLVTVGINCSAPVDPALMVYQTELYQTHFSNASTPLGAVVHSWWSN